MKRKVTEQCKARGDKYLVKLECGHKRYTKSKTAKTLVCLICKEKAAEE